MTITNDFFNRLAGNSGESLWQNKLNGVWLDTHGWNFISQPQPHMPGGSDFEMHFHQMRETIRFKSLGIARNVGITGEAGFWHGVAYEIGIETPNGEGIHHEMGHFLLKVKDDINGETPEKEEGVVIRQATIPRANAMMTLGVLKRGSVTNVPDADTFYDARPTTSDSDLQQTIDAEFNSKIQAIESQGGPDFNQPLDWLKLIFPPNNSNTDWVFEFRHDKSPSQMASGQRVVNPLSIGNLLSDFWIAERVTENDQKIDLLQYAQKVNLIFHGIEWPHVALNTLIRQTG